MMDEFQNKKHFQGKESVDAIDAIEEFEKQKKRGRDDELKSARGAFLDKKISRKLTTEEKRFLKIVIFVAALFMCLICWKAYGVRNVFSHKEKVSGEIIKNNVSHPVGEIGDIHKQEQKVLKNNDHKVFEQTLVKQGEMKEIIEPEDEILQRRLNSGLTNTENQRISEKKENISVSELSADDEKNPSSTLKKNMEPLVLKGHQASNLKNRDLLLTQGAMLDCQLETRIVSTQPGMVSCHTTRDVYASSGRVVLIDKGSRVVGHYDSGILHGQARIFILWDRIETPQGVAVNLDSPGTGPLGEGGVDGWVDNHFGQRFGGAILISLIGDVGEYIANLGNRDGRARIQFANTNEGTQQASTEVLKHSLSIQPTLYKNQGERVSIFVARDLDFSNVYELKPTYR